MCVTNDDNDAQRSSNIERKSRYDPLLGAPTSKTLCVRRLCVYACVCVCVIIVARRSAVTQLNSCCVILPLLRRSGVKTIRSSYIFVCLAHMYAACVYVIYIYMCVCAFTGDISTIEHEPKTNTLEAQYILTSNFG